MYSPYICVYKWKSATRCTWPPFAPWPAPTPTASRFVPLSLSHTLTLTHEHIHTGDQQRLDGQGLSRFPSLSFSLFFSFSLSHTRTHSHKHIHARRNTNTHTNIHTRTHTDANAYCLKVLPNAPSFSGVTTSQGSLITTPETLHPTRTQVMNPPGTQGPLQGYLAHKKQPPHPTSKSPIADVDACRLQTPSNFTGVPRS